MKANTIRIGAFAPLSPPGWVDAGRHLLAGIEMAAADFNAGGGIGGRELELLVRDTAADPARAVAAVDELAGLGVVALAGEYHSVAARAIAGRAAALGLPYLCSSAVIDDLTAHPADWIARLCPPQSIGWGHYVDFLHRMGQRQVTALAQPSDYWSSGLRIIREAVADRGGSVIEIDARACNPDALCEELVRTGATALLLLVGVPEPATAFVRAIRRDARLGSILIGAPAGQPELPGWAASLGHDGAGIPFLRYRPWRLEEAGVEVEARLRQRLGVRPSFVALEGYDAIRLIAEILRSGKGISLPATGFWQGVDIEGSRGRIRLSKTADTRIWQWQDAPVQIADLDPTGLQCRTLATIC